jgi:pimeloyl-ACP methyl ester carboxylesterase
MTRSLLRPAALFLSLGVAFACADGSPLDSAESAVRSGPEPGALRAERVGESPVAPFDHWRVARTHAPGIDIYVARRDAERRPLLVYVQGSKCLPLFMVATGRLASTIPAEEVPSLLGRVHFAVVERRGLTSFGPPPATHEEMMAEARCTAEHGGVSKGERVRDVGDAVRALSLEPWVASVSVLGHSEGADVAAGVGQELDRDLAAVGLLAGAGITRFFDDIMLARRAGDSVQEVFDDLLWLTGPSPTGEYHGASVTRQITYAIDSTPLEDLRLAHVPVFVAAGARDEKVPIETSDAFVAELLRNRERKVRYVIVPGADHALASADGASRWREIVDAYIDWSLSGEKDRSVVVRR